MTLYVKVIRRFDVTDYGAKADGTTDDSAAIRAAMAAAFAAGGGTVFLPNGTYIVSNDGTQALAGCIRVKTGIIVRGESRVGTIIKLKEAQPAFTRVFTVDSDDDIVFENFTIDGNSGGQPQPEEHMAGIFVGSAAGNVDRCIIRELTIKNCCGDGIDIWGGCRDTVVDAVYATANGRSGIALNGSAQNGITIRKCWLVENAAQQIDFEPPDGPMSNVVIDDCRLVQHPTSLDYALALSGTQSTKQIIGCSVTNCVIVGCTVVRWVRDLWFAGNKLTATASNLVPVLQIDGLVERGVFEGNVIASGSDSDGRSVYISSRPSAGDRPKNLIFANNQLYGVNANNYGYIISVQNPESVLISGNQIIGGSNTVNSGIDIRSTQTFNPMERVVIVNNYIRDYANGVVVWGYDGAGVVNEFVMNGNVVARVNKASMNGFSLDFDGVGVIRRAECIGNDVRNLTNDWLTFPKCPMLIGGNRFGGALYSVNGSPAGIVENVGAMALSRTPVPGSTTSTFWVKTSGSGTNSGWTSK